MGILFMSGHPLDTLLNRGLLEPGVLQDEAVEFLQKPFFLTTFIAAAERALQQKP